MVRTKRFSVLAASTLMALLFIALATAPVFADSPNPSDPPPPPDDPPDDPPEGDNSESGESISLKILSPVFGIFLMPAF